MDNAVIDNFLATQDVPGIVALATSASETIYHGAYGAEPDSAFALMSMTKPITSMAIMILQEQGRLDIDEPACNYLEKFRGRMVIANVDASSRSYDEVPQDHDFTIRELLNHTAGFGYTFCNEILFAFSPKNELAFPLLHQPGTEWTYGVSTLLLGNIVSQVTEMNLGDALKNLVLEPLGMDRTAYTLPDNQVAPHQFKDGNWQALPLYPEMPFGDAGLISTAEDYGKFLRCLLNRGAPLLNEESFSQMTSNQIGDKFVQTLPAANPAFTHPFPTGGGIDKWGLGFQIHMEPRPGMRSPGSYSWCGLLNTYFWVDPVKAIAGVVLMQLLPLFEPRCRAALDGFEKLIYEQT